MLSWPTKLNSDSLFRQMVYLLLRARGTPIYRAAPPFLIHTACRA